MIGNVKVISLDRSIERKNEFIKNNSAIKYEFVSAVDGQLLTSQDISKAEHFINPLPFPSRGAYGVALSHLKLWNEAIEAGVSVTVAEDDAIFRSDFHVKTEVLISELPSDWDIVLWGWNFDSILSLVAMPNISPSVMLFSQALLRQNITHFQKDRSIIHTFKLDKCFGLPCYTISPTGAKKFKQLCFPLKNFELFFPVLNRKIPNTGIDIAMNRIYSTTNSYVSFPPLVVTKNEHEISTIQKIHR